MRLFAALPMPSAVVERLTRLRLRLSTPRDGLRWSEPEQWHVTLQFYGEIDAKRAACLRMSLSDLKAASPQMEMEGLGMFGNKGILYASIRSAPDLLVLQREIVLKSRSCGIASDSRPFHPHVTLARSKGKVGQQTLNDLGKPDLLPFGPEIQWIAEEVLLVESTLRPQGAEYTKYARLPLHVSKGQLEGNL